MKVTKKILSGIAVIGLTAIGITYGVFDNTGYYFYADTNSYNTNGNYGYQVGSNGNLTTSFGDADKKVFYWNFGYDNLVKTVLAWYDNKLYFIGGEYNVLKSQGYIQNFCIREKSTRNEYLHDNCTYDTPISTIIEANPNFTDYAFTVYGSTTPTRGYGNTPLQFCLSDENYDYCISCSAYAQSDNTPCQSGLTGSLNITATDYETITNFNWGNSPIAGGGSGGGGGTGEETTGQLYCPPIKYQISMYGNKYNTGLCYSYTEEISGGQVTTVTPISIFDAFPTYEQYRQAYRLIRNNCHTSTINTYEECQTALQSLGKKPSQVMYKVIDAELPIDKVYQYCHLQLDYTEEEKRNLSTCDLKEEETYYATGLNGNTNSNPNPIEGYTDILEETDTVLTPEDGSIFDAILPDGVLSWKDVIFNANFMSHFATLYTKITLMFRARPYQDGILPPVITSLLLLIILFKVYKK